MNSYLFKLPVALAIYAELLGESSEFRVTVTEIQKI